MFLSGLCLFLELAHIQYASKTPSIQTLCRDLHGREDKMGTDSRIEFAFPKYAKITPVPHVYPPANNKYSIQLNTTVLFHIVFHVLYIEEVISEVSKLGSPRGPWMFQYFRSRKTLNWIHYK